MNKAEAELKNSPFNLGLIGFGNIGKVHYDALTKSGQLDFVVQAIADINQPTISNIRSYGDYRELLRNPEIQAVTINTPPNTHHQLVIEALKESKHVLVEKPPALTVTQCEEMIVFAHQKERVLFMAFHARYNPAVLATRSELKGKDIRKINIDYREYAPNYHAVNGWIFDPKVAGGGVLMDSGINALSIVTFVLPELPSFAIDSAKFNKAGGFKTETEAEVSFSCGDKVVGTIVMDWMYKGPEVRKVTFETDQGEYTVDIVKNTLSENGHLLMSVDARRDVVDQESEYKGVYQDFAKHLTSGDSLVSTKELAFINEAYGKVELYSKE